MVLWVARSKHGNEYWLLYGRTPYMRIDGSWDTDGLNCRRVRIPSSLSSVRLKPGEGPVRVQLSEYQKKGG